MRTSDLVRDALRGIRLHRLRSLLTAASFASGTAAAVALFAVTDGAREELLRQLRALGTDIVVVRALGEAPAGTAPLSLGDASALERGLPFVRRSAPVRSAASEVALADRRVTVRVVGTTGEYFRLLRVPFLRGGPLPDERDGTGLCVLGSDTARTLFPESQAYGALVRVNGNWYRVAGVLAPAARAASSRSDGSGLELYLPIAETLEPARSDRSRVEEIWLRIDEGVSTEAAARVVERALLRRHEGHRVFEVLTPQGLLRQERAARGLLDALLAASALAAFALGAVAMASLAWQAVAERRTEIAIRRAVGARQEEILGQFLLEAGLLASLGGAVGIAAGVVAAGAAATAGGWPWRISARRLALAWAVALAVGVAAAIRPARRAAALDPVAALRFER